MLNMDQATLRKSLEQLDEAAYDYADWHGNLLRAIVCGLPCNPHDLAAAAHLTCRFGQWYYERAPAELRGQPAFAAIGMEHEHLHRIAARLLREVAAGAPIGGGDFAELVEGSARLRLELDSLRHEVQDALQNCDALTGAYGRAAVLPELREWHTLAKRGVKQCCIVMMDLDHLVEINDTCGHQVGDGVLTCAVRYLTEHLRPYDKVFRYGGDEFLISLPGADLAMGQAVITRVREGLARKLLVVGPDGIARHVTASFGLALLDPEVGLLGSIDRADQALLLAKAAGRNRAISWDPSVTTGKQLKRLQIEAATR
jgi:diguanylate cyclase